MLSLHDIAHFYGHRLILKHISLNIPAGVTLLIGPNGAGKTTLLSIMGGLITPSSGSVTFPDHARIAMLGHNTFLYPELSAFENLQFWARLYDISPTQTMLEEALSKVDLGNFGHERAGTYSRGMAQRLSLARLLLIEPEIMLLDEPGTGLDTHSLGMLHQTIQEKAQKGTTIVWVTHSVETDWRFADSVIRLDKTVISHHLPAPDYASQFLAPTAHGSGAEQDSMRLPGSSACCHATDKNDTANHATDCNAPPCNAAGDNTISDCVTGNHKTDNSETCSNKTGRNIKDTDNAQGDRA